MDLNHFKNLKKCNSEFKKIIDKAINNPSELSNKEVTKIKIFKIIDMMYYYLSNNENSNINEIYDGVKRDYDNFILTHPDVSDENSESSESSEMSSPTSVTNSSSDSNESSESEEESDLESNDSSSVYSEKSDDVEYNKMITLTIMYHNKNKNNKELMIVRK